MRLNQRLAASVMMLSGGALVAVGVLKRRHAPRYHFTYYASDQGWTPVDEKTRDDLRALIVDQGFSLEPKWLPVPKRRGARGGGGPVDTAVVNFALQLGPIAAKAFVGGVAAAVGADAWKRTKALLKNMRQHPSPTIPAARFQLAIQMRAGQTIWARLPSADHLPEALDALDEVKLPPMPSGEFFWALDWDPERRLWMLELR
jgi:hypothetical protein